MQSIEILLILAGALLVVISIYLERKQRAEMTVPLPKQPALGLTAENALKLQSSLTELLRELQTLGHDVTVDLEGKLGELKELLHLADKKLGELSEAEDKGAPARSEQPKKDKQAPLATTRSPELQITVEDEYQSQPTNRYQEIYRMADAGLSTDEIARRAQMGKGEIQLILSLRKKD
jgi:hypothetical protein